MLRRTSLLTALLFAFTCLLAPAAVAASGSVTDPAGDFPDIRRLSYSNATSQVVMTMRYASLADVQNESFYIRWGTSASYQVFNSPSAGLRELRFNGTRVRCADLRVTRLPDIQSTRVVVPRRCLPQAPKRLKFQGIATQGMQSVDETVVSPWVARG
jgi:hypothetical protein